MALLICLVVVLLMYWVGSLLIYEADCIGDHFLRLCVGSMVAIGLIGGLTGLYQIVSDMLAL